jgi:hypothetical protein
MESSTKNQDCGKDGCGVQMLENHADTGVSSKDTIDKLPPEQLAMYKARYGT